MAITRTLLLYRLLQYILFPFIVLYFAARLLRRPEYLLHFGERLGKLPRSFGRTAAGSIWLHAVSAGEVASATAVLRALRKECPDAALYLSTSTIAGREMAQEQATELCEGIFYVPIDFVFCVRRVLRTIRPAVVVVLETEIWPHLFSESVRSGAHLVLANARISDRTWPRYYRYRALFAPVLSLAASIIAQSLVDRKRYSALGARPRELSVGANLKYDAATTGREPFTLPRWGASHVWIAASTVGPNERGSLHEHGIDEDDIVLEAFRHLQREFGNLLLVLAPRQPHRFEAVAAKIKAAGIPVLCRTELKRTPDLRLTLPGILLLDTVGELARLYASADVVFVGGSIAPRGGHNILEAAAAGVPIIIGPHMENFAEIAREFREMNAVVEVASARELATSVRTLLSDREEAVHLGQRGRAVVLRNAGTADALAKQIGKLQTATFLKKSHNSVPRFFLRVLSCVWEYGGSLKRRKGESIAASRRPVPRPVVSIGGISMGGSGKTPLCDYLAAQLSARGHFPAVLTRGYRRRSPVKTLVLARGAHVSAALTGDEAQIFLQSGNAVLGIGPDRYQNAQAVLAVWPQTDIFLLDDGFQHARMARDLDIIVIDGLDPFAGSELVPLGRLREPLTGLARADAFVITRTVDGRRRGAITEALRSYNKTAPVFFATIQAREWRSFESGKLVDLPSRARIAAFCGLGNPQTFWNTLESLGCDVVFRWSFPDHHQYKPTEIQRLVHQARAHGATALVTTEKDSINLPSVANAICEGLGLHWLRVDLVLETADQFFAFLDEALKPYMKPLTLSPRKP